MNKTGRYRCSLVFGGCLAAVLSWQGQNAPMLLLHWEPGPAGGPGLLFSARDSVTLARVTARERTFAARPSNDIPVITVFDKLVYQALLEKCRGNPRGSQAFFLRADSIAAYVNEFFDLPFLRETLHFYGGMTGDTLKTKLAAERFFYQGYELYRQRQFVEAEKAFVRGRQLYAALKDTKRVAETEFHLAGSTLLRGEYARCRDWSAAALRHAGSPKYTPLIKWLHWYIGDAYLNLSNYLEAASEFKESLRLAEASRDTLLAVCVYGRLAVLFRRQGNFPKALGAVQCSQRLSRLLRDQTLEKVCLVQLGMINHQLGNYSEAEENYKKVYELNRHAGHPDLNAVLATNWAYLYIDLGNWDRALDLQMQALTDEPDPQSRRQAIRFSNIGLIYAKLNDHKNSLKYQALALQTLSGTSSSAADLTWIHLRMADSYRELGQKKEAEREYSTALTISENTKGTVTQILSFLGLGSLYRENEDYTRALTWQKQALELSQQTQNPDLEWNAAFELGKTHESVQDFEAAQSAYDLALKKVEASRAKISADTLRMSFFAIKQDVYDRLVALALQARKDPEAALSYSERSRARTMLDLMGERFYRQAFVSEMPRLEELQGAMTAEMVFIEYKQLADKLVIWVIKKDSFAADTVSVSRMALAQLVREFLDTIGAGDFARFREYYAKDAAVLFKQSVQLGERLYGYLIAPVEKYLSSTPVVYFVPDEILYYLPFAALTTPRRQFLIEEYRIAYAPSLAVYGFLAKRRLDKPRRRAPMVLAVGNPTGDLRSSEREVKAIAGLFAGSQVLLRAQATKRAVMDGLRSPIDYFHFAGHCRINEKNPMYSALVLHKNQAAASTLDAEAAGNPNADILTVQDLMNCSLEHIEFATLSACETALGKLSKGEGIMGLSQVLLGSGISTLVSSLWKVDDQHSADLMERFYHYLSANPYDKAEALRRAQLDKITWCRQDKIVKYPFPYFWASYVLNGMIQ